MRSTPIIVFILALGVAFTILGATGIGGEIFGQSEIGDAGTQDMINESAADADLELDDEDEGGFTGDVRGIEDESSIVGFIISGGSFGVSLAANVVLLPRTLVNLGFPEYLARALGHGAQIIATVGIIQFIIGRTWS